MWGSWVPLAASSWLVSLPSTYSAWEPSFGPKVSAAPVSTSGDNR